MLLFWLSDRLQTIVFRVRKQWDYHCHTLICMVKTIVHSLHFTLTTTVILLCTLLKWSIIHSFILSFVSWCTFTKNKINSGNDNFQVHVLMLQAKFKWNLAFFGLERFFIYCLEYNIKRDIGVESFLRFIVVCTCNISYSLISILMY